MSKEFLEQLEPSRRAFVKKLVAAGAAVPLVASFSIDALAQSPSSSRASSQQSCGSGSSSSQSGYSACQPDLGYTGPGRFAAHLSYAGASTDTGASLNGELHLLVGDGANGARARRITTNLDLVDDAIFATGSILINGNYAASIQSGKASLDATDLASSVGNLDSLLNAMAAGQATVLVTVTYLGNNVNLTGPITAAGPGYDFVNLKS